jgi:5-deoxy-glucuronate isomerase
VILEGACRIRAGGQTWDSVGSRAGVFTGPADSRTPGATAPPAAPVVLVAPGEPVEVEALGAGTGIGGPIAGGGASVVVASAPGGTIHATRLIPPEEIAVERRGSGATERRINRLLPPEVAAGRLILFEVYTPAGHWSSWPPHKHDTEDPPREALLEELYHYRFARPEGFAFQRVYTPDRSLDVALTPGDGDVVLVPRGYHPVGAPAGYDTYYLNVMAGPNRAWFFTIDPDHAWQMDWDPGAPRT